MKRVVITGIGIVSSIGNDTKQVLSSLQNSKSNIAFDNSYKELGMRSQVAGMLNINIEKEINKKNRRFMGQAAAYAYISMKEAIEDSGLSDTDISNPRTGIIAGSGGMSSQEIYEANKIAKKYGASKVGPFRVPRAMGSTVSANLATAFCIKGVNYSVSSACSTSTHCIGNAYQQIQFGLQDIVFSGGGEELIASQSVLFDGMKALSSNFNSTPQKASRPFDVDRDGFVISGGGGILVLEELNHAKARNAKIYGEIIGYAANSDGGNMVAPNGDGAIRCMSLALKNVKDNIDYINDHGTSTPIGDKMEIYALKEVFRNSSVPKNSSTKCLTGHALGAAGVHEAIYSLLMLNNNFISPSVNIDNLDPLCDGANIVREYQELELKTVMSNNFGFGGTNATLVFKKI